MTPEKIKQLNEYTCEQYTQYVIGYIAAALGFFCCKGDEPTWPKYIDKGTLTEVQTKIVPTTIQFLSYHKNHGVTNTPYDISGVFNEDGTILTIAYEMDNDFIESPFRCIMTALNKNQIH